MAQQSHAASGKHPVNPHAVLFYAAVGVFLVGATILLHYRLTVVSNELSRINETFNHNVTEIRDSMKKVEADVQDYKERLTGLDQRTKGLDDQVKNLEGRLDKLGRDIQKNFDEAKRDSQKNFDEVLQRLSPQ